MPIRQINLNLNSTRDIEMFKTTGNNYTWIAEAIGRIMSFEKT